MSRLCSFVPVCVLCAAVVLGCGKKTDSVPPTESAPAPTGTLAAGPTEADKTETALRLRRIMLAFFSYHDSNQRFPIGIAGPNGQLGLSWRVALLPLLGEEEAKLYQQFNTKEPWDSEHNKKLIAKMPKVFASPGTAAASGKTYFRSFAGPRAFIPAPKGKEAPPGATQPLGQTVRGRWMPDFTDGTSNTLAVVESSEAVEWTKPDDMTYLGEGAADADAALPPVPKLGGVYPGGFYAAMADGTVRFFPNTLSEKDLRALITVNGGDTLGSEAVAILRAPPHDG